MPKLLVVLLLALSGVVLTQLPAQACSCVSQDVPAKVKGATAVLLGTVTDRVQATDKVTYQVAVEKVFKGSAATTVTLSTGAQSSACGLDNLVAERRYVVFGTVQGEVIEVNSCGGTALASVRLLTSVTGVTGAGSAPTPAPPPEPVTATLTRVDGTEPVSFSRLAAPGGALVIVGLLGLLFLRRLTRAR